MKSSMKSLIIGNGEVGKALKEVLNDVYLQDDKDTVFLDKVEILHICFPYSKDFIGEVKDYMEEYRPDYTIIHSTVPVGTTAKCSSVYSCYHSPIRGIHPYLGKSIKTFIKYLSPPNLKLKRYFEKAGIRIKLVNKPEETEALKLWSTAQYGLFIMLEKQIHEFCETNNLNFNIIYKEANNTYNEGYEEMKMPHVKRPVLKHKKGKIGGHCIIPNCDLLKTPITKFIKKLNKDNGEKN